MDLVSLLITLIGIMVLLGLYLMSRLYDQSPIKQSKKEINISTHTDAEGNELSSIKADFPAQDKGISNRSLSNNATANNTASAPSTNRATADSSSSQTSTPNQNQYVLFIAAQSENQLDGDQIIKAMGEHKLSFGEKDIYHYYVNKDKGLFSVANGIAPWTLTEADLVGKTTPGLSLIMRKPTPIDSIAAIETFVQIAEKLAASIDGELQNSRQQIFLDTDKEEMLRLS